MTEQLLHSGLFKVSMVLPEWVGDAERTLCVMLIDAVSPASGSFLLTSKDHTNDTTTKQSA